MSKCLVVSRDSNVSQPLEWKEIWDAIKQSLDPGESILECRGITQMPTRNGEISLCFRLVTVTEIPNLVNPNP